MADELSINTENAVALTEQFEMGNLIKPLQKEIFLFDSFVAGTSHLEDVQPVKEIKAGNLLTLRREKNKYDEMAVLILDEQGRKLGYIPEKDNVIFARLMDAGKMLVARVKEIKQKGTITQIGIGIFLVDF